MRALIVGAGGLVGRALAMAAPAGWQVAALDRAGLDITDAAAVRAAVAQHRPDVIVNCAGHIAVDKVEAEKELAWRINADGPRYLAEALAPGQGRLIHISTNYVFSGDAAVPYAVDAETAPVNYYGVSKRAGELAVLEVLGSRAVVVRTSWVYGLTGRSFFNSILKALREKQLATVVDDQLGTPTSAPVFARVLWKIARQPQVHGVLHWTDEGVASWYDFAQAIAEDAIACGLVPAASQVLPIVTAQYPTAVPRPMYGVLDKRSTVAAVGEVPRYWRTELRALMTELAAQGQV
jgi:dTDP-4-dehydrorhamnose reductase